MCFLRLETVVKENSHCWQMKGFPPECVRMCVSRLPACVKEKLHCLETKTVSQHVGFQIKSFDS